MSKYIYANENANGHLWQSQSQSVQNTAPQPLTLCAVPAGIPSRNADPIGSTGSRRRPAGIRGRSRGIPRMAPGSRCRHSMEPDCCSPGCVVAWAALAGRRPSHRAPVDEENGIRNEKENVKLLADHGQLGLEHRAVEQRRRRKGSGGGAAGVAIALPIAPGRPAAVHCKL
jgi:hypothetical protein